MSMPEFPPIDPCLSQENALNMILHSIALEEAALSHVINAEGEKVQAVVASVNANKKCCLPDMQKLLDVNQSVYDVLEQIKEIQMLLKSKMNSVIEYLPKPDPPLYCPEPEPEPDCLKPPEKICVCTYNCNCRCNCRCADCTANILLNLSKCNFGSFSRIKK